MSRIALVTGASSGIGYATALLLSQNGYDLIICARRDERLVELEKKIAGKVKTIKLVFDVRNREKVFECINSLPDEWKSIDFLINNAGNAHGLSNVQDADLDDWDAMIDINVKGLMYVTKAVLPFMLARNKGHILNVSSIAGKEVYPKGNAYCASKHAVGAFNDSLRIDLNGTGIKVSLINPGAVNTEFSLVRFKGDQEKADKFYEGFHPLYAKDIAQVIWFILSQPEHINLSDVTILPNAQASATMIHRS